ncbi:MAG: competence protein CoiA family protein [Gemmataceae bacterium]
MLLNHARRSPVDWDDAQRSLCPDCGAALLARRGRVVIWHWAHQGGKRSRDGEGCVSSETFWHLAWKKVYHQFPGWEIEVPIELQGRKYRLDACNLQRSKAREFVHSLSESYMRKHLALRASGLDVLWIFDGEAFASARVRSLRGGGRKHLLKPKARWLQGRIGGLVHYDHLLWREWKADCWYPLDSQRAAGMTQAFRNFKSRLQEQAAFTGLNSGE